MFRILKIQDNFLLTWGSLGETVASGTRQGITDMPTCNFAIDVYIPLSVQMSLLSQEEI